MIYDIDIELTPEIAEEIRQAFITRLDEKYHLVYTDYQSNLNQSGRLIQDCIETKSGDELFDNNDDWISDNAFENANYYLNEIKSNILSDGSLEHLHPFVEEWLDTEENRAEIRYIIEDRDESNPFQDLINNTRLNARATLYTNYDCLLHNYDMGNTYSYEEYVKDIIDVLNLNPFWVRQTFLKCGINTVGHFPDIRKRNGKEAVSYMSFAEELLNQTSYGLLTFTGVLPLQKLIDNRFGETKYIIVPKGNYCGMFSEWRGGGSLMEMQLLRDLKIPTRWFHKTKYDKLELEVEVSGNYSYCISEVYDVSPSYWNKPFILTFKNT
ncbi:hypothetical protein NXX53_06620 [Bacteroides salyersiae]|nr:hypothetical protein [uncultured Bacteroides sp.]MCS2956950.1 hypothetical protein [Bacteroides salyersiae]